jgi:hypothetical protein
MDDSIRNYYVAVLPYAADVRLRTGFLCLCMVRACTADFGGKFADELLISALITMSLIGARDREPFGIFLWTSLAKPTRSCSILRDRAQIADALNF